MSDFQPFKDASDSGWLVAGALAIWHAVVRVAGNRFTKSLETRDKAMTELTDSIAALTAKLDELKLEMTSIKTRLDERDRYERLHREAP